MNTGAKIIAVVTGTRADYGLLYWTLKALQDSSYFELRLLVGGMHLVEHYGKTINEIIADGFSIAATFDYLDAEATQDTPLSIVHATAKATGLFGEYFDNNKPDLLLVLGDRFEALAAAQSALLLKIPIAHIHGGEISEGAIDDVIRHCLTKMSCLHFATTDAHRRRVIQMGEQPETVINVGAPGLESLYRENLMSLSALTEALTIDLSVPTLLLTYHPETLSNIAAEDQVDELIEALEQFPELQILATCANADAGGVTIAKRFKNYIEQRPGHNLWCQSLGRYRYLSALQYISAAVGNSSSGIIEVPSFYKPTVNIGRRQKGRMASQTVLHCAADTQSIIKTIKYALSVEFNRQLKNFENPYGQGDTSEKIVLYLKQWFDCRALSAPNSLISSASKLKFYDLPESS